MENIESIYNKLELRTLQPEINPLLGRIKQIYDATRKISSIDDSKFISESIISEKESIFSNSKTTISTVLRNDIGNKTIKKSITNDEINFSPFDVILTLIQIAHTGDKIFFPTVESKMRIEDIDDILFLKVVNKTTFIFLSSGKYYKSKKSLEEFDQALCNHQSFYKINKQYIINLKKIVEITYNNSALIPYNIEDKLGLTHDIIDATKKDDNDKKKLINQHTVSNDEISAIYSKYPENVDKAKQEITEMKKKRIFDFLKVTIPYERIKNSDYFSIPIKEELHKTIQKVIMEAYKTR